MSEFQQKVEEAVSRWRKSIDAAPKRAAAREIRADEAILTEIMTKVHDQHGPGPTAKLRDRTIRGLVVGARLQTY